MNRQFAIVILCLLSFSAHAERNFYGILSAGYVQNEVQDFELDKASYKLGIGYELTPQWYVEAGFQALGELNASDQFATAGSDVAEFSGLYLAALGKARGQYGELFYRLGMMRVDANVQSISNLTCPGDPAVASVGDAICSVDNSLFAVLITACLQVFLVSVLISIFITLLCCVSKLNTSKANKITLLRQPTWVSGSTFKLS